MQSNCRLDCMQLSTATGTHTQLGLSRVQLLSFAQLNVSYCASLACHRCPLACLSVRLSGSLPAPSGRLLSQWQASGQRGGKNLTPARRALFNQLCSTRTSYTCRLASVAHFVWPNNECRPDSWKLAPQQQPQPQPPQPLAVDRRHHGCLLSFNFYRRLALGAPLASLVFFDKTVISAPRLQTTTN